MKKIMLYELPVILFNEIIKKPGTNDVKELVYAPHGNTNRYICQYVFMPENSVDEVPTLVLVDTRSPDSIFVGVKLIILTKPPKFNSKGIVEEFDIHASAEVNFASYTERPVCSGIMEISLCLRINMVYPGIIRIGDIFNRFSNLYSLDIAKMADELYYDKKYNWVTMYNHSIIGKIKPLAIRGKIL